MVEAFNLAVVVCHGSYFTPAPYMPLIEALKAIGIDAYCPQLPTADLTKLNVGDVSDPDFDREPPIGGYPQGKDDSEVILSLLDQLINHQGKKVLLIGHSAGGWVATQSAHPELQVKFRSGKGVTGGIIGILYVGAFVIPVGESINSFFQPKDGNLVTPPFMRFHRKKHGASGLGTMVNPEKFLFNDLESTAAQKWAAGLTASPILTTKLTNDAYSTLPCAYMVLERDLTLLKEYQEGMVAAQSQKSGNFTLYRCPTGHFPFLSWTEGMIGNVKDFLKRI